MGGQEMKKNELIDVLIVVMLIIAFTLGYMTGIK